MNRFCITLFLFTLCSLFSSLREVSASSASDSTSLQELIAEYEKLPQSENELTNQLVSEVLQGHRHVADRIFQGSRPGEVRTFVEALLNHGNEETLLALGRNLERNQATTLRFLIEVTQSVQTQPQLLVRIRSRLSRIEELLELNPVEKPHFGERVLTSALFLGGIASFLYSMEASLPDMWMKRHLSANLYYLPMFFGFHFLLAVAGEFNVLKMSIPSYVRSWRNWRASRSYMSELKSLVDQLGTSPLAAAQIERLRYFTSEQADRDAKEAVALIVSDLSENENVERALHHLIPFLRSRVFFDLVERMKQRLTHEELQELEKKINRVLAHVQNGQESASSEENILDRTFTFGLQYEVARFESEVRREMTKYLREQGAVSDSEILSELAFRVLERNQRAVDATRPAAWTKLSWVGLSISATVLGLSASLGTTPTPLDQLMPMGIAEFIRGNPQLVYSSSAFFAMPAITHFYFRFMPTLMKLKSARSMESGGGLSFKDRVLAVKRVLEYYGKRLWQGEIPQGESVAEDSFDRLVGSEVQSMPAPTSAPSTLNRVFRRLFAPGWLRPNSQVNFKFCEQVL